MARAQRNRSHLGALLLGAGVALFAGASSGCASSEDDELTSESDSETCDVEVVVPQGTKPGDIIDVRLPDRAGGGLIKVRVPQGVRFGDTFDISV